MTYENDPRRPLPRSDIDRGNSTAWGVGAAIVAAVIIVGGMMLYGNSDRSTTASTSPQTTQTAPSPSPTPAPPAKTQ